ncbi:hypothetical protein FACS1894189_3790 [Planctomycetales bacterium]|nr:hypothetical protein FACS1894189_3790 [Planctomycetales bacterium]
MRNLNLSRRSFASSITLRALTALILVLAPAAAYAAKGPCNSQLHSPVTEGGCTCVNGYYTGTEVRHYSIYSCAGTSENDCDPAKNTRVSAKTYLYTTEQSDAQLQAKIAEANAISNAYIACMAAGATVATTGGLWSFVFGGPAGPLIAGVLIVAGAVITVTCTAVNAQQTAAHQARVNSCAFVSSKKTQLADTMSNSCY